MRIAVRFCRRITRILTKVPGQGHALKQFFIIFETAYIVNITLFTAIGRKFMNRAKYTLLLLLTLPFLTGFFWSKSKVDSIQGFWKAEAPSDKGYVSFLEVGKDYIVFEDYDGYREDGLILEEVEGVVLIRKAGIKEVFARIVMRDDDHILFEFPGRKLGFVRSSKEERQNIFKPPVENIAGLYRNQDGTMVFQFSKNDIVKNGASLGLSIVSEDQMYFAVSGNSIQFTLTPVQDGSLLYREQPGTSPVVLFKASPEEAAALSRNQAAEQNSGALDGLAILQSRVEFTNFSATIPGPGNDMRPLNFNLVLEMQYLPEEKGSGATRPTLAQLEVFRTVVVQLESKLRDHMNAFLTGQSFTNLMGDRGPQLVKAEVKRFVNNELDKYDFESMKIPKGISRRRVTGVLLPSWTMM